MLKTARCTGTRTARVVQVLALAATMAAALPSFAQQAATSNSRKEFREFKWVRKVGVSEPVCRLDCQSACVNHYQEFCPIQRAWMSVCKAFSERQGRCRKVKVQVRECKAFEETHQECASVLKRRLECGPLEATRQRCAQHQEESAAWNACVGSSAGPIRRCHTYFERIVECQPHIVRVTRCENVIREMTECQALPQELTDPSMPTVAARTAYLERVCRAVQEAEPACGNPQGQCGAGCQVVCR